jgi:hypothetical protein
MRFVVDKMALGQVFSEYLGFTCSTFIVIYHPGPGIIGQIMANVPSGLSLTPPQEIKKCTFFSANIRA